MYANESSFKCAVYFQWWLKWHAMFITFFLLSGSDVISFESRPLIFVYLYTCTQSIQKQIIKYNIKNKGQFHARQRNFEFFKIKFCTIKLIPTKSWNNGLFEITEIMCVLSMCLMWEGMNSREFEFHYIWNFWKEILNQVLTSKKTLQLT